MDRVSDMTCCQKIPGSRNDAIASIIVLRSRLKQGSKPAMLIASHLVVVITLIVGAEPFTTKPHPAESS